jgi:hypothetical protein
LIQLTKLEKILSIKVILMNIKKTIYSIQQGKFSFVFSFWMLFIICNFVIWGIGKYFLKLYGDFSSVEKILFIFYFLFSMYFFFITTKGVLKSKSSYKFKNKITSILSTVVIIFWCMQALGILVIYSIDFLDKF